MGTPPGMGSWLPGGSHGMEPFTCGVSADFRQLVSESWKRSHAGGVRREGRRTLWFGVRGVAMTAQRVGVSAALRAPVGSHLQPRELSLVQTRAFELP